MDEYCRRSPRDSVVLGAAAYVQDPASLAKKVSRQEWVFHYFVPASGPGVGALLAGSSVVGALVVEQTGEELKVRMEMPYRLWCYRGDLNASVARTSDETTVTIQAMERDCEESRFVLKNDGTGGRLESRRGSQWVPDGEDHRLTLKQ